MIVWVPVYNDRNRKSWTFDSGKLRSLAKKLRLPPVFDELMRMVYQDLVLPEVVANRLMSTG